MLSKQTDEFDDFVAVEQVQAPNNAANLTEVFLYGQIPTTPKPQSVRNNFVIENKYAHHHFMHSNRNYSLAHPSESR